ncbi:hypothetical protein SDC9_204634 [bioreactor metagenome]|uniref:Uncharacterized protein n=1 Tax=bioreactor metagenome TaxID=1076179 RepID=A0A645J038_9ZZZZ
MAGVLFCHQPGGQQLGNDVGRRHFRQPRAGCKRGARRRAAGTQQSQHQQAVGAFHITGIAAGRTLHSKTPMVLDFLC